jgi:hypothetical protein
VPAGQEEADLEALQERERAIRQLESDIVDVNTIFKVCTAKYGCGVPLSSRSGVPLSRGVVYR